MQTRVYILQTNFSLFSKGAGVCFIFGQEVIYINIGLVELVNLVITPIAAVIVLYYVVKLAVKNAIKELKKDGHL